MSSRTIGDVIPHAEPRPGSKAIWGLAIRQSQRGDTHATRLTVFRKGDRTLLVHEYGSKCDILELSDTPPRIKKSYEWSQPYHRVATKLIKSGWVPVKDDNRKEVRNEH